MISRIFTLLFVLLFVFEASALYVNVSLWQRDATQCGTVDSCNAATSVKTFQENCGECINGYMSRYWVCTSEGFANVKWYTEADCQGTPSDVYTSDGDCMPFDFFTVYGPEEYCFEVDCIFN